MPISTNHRFFGGARVIAQRAGTEALLNALKQPVVDFANRVGCTSVGSSGSTPRGITFRLDGRKEDLFAFWVERLADKKRGLAAISFDPDRVSDELRPAYTQLLRELQRMTGETVLNNGTYPSEAVGFVTVSDGLAVIGALDQFVGDAFDRLGARAFAPYDPTQMGGRKKKSSETSLLTWDADGAPPGVDPKVWAQIRLRRGQRKFRQGLLLAYEGRCAATGCSVEAALEAAHVTPYSQDAVYEVTDGVLLRADVHTLFDLHLISVDPETYTVRVAPSLLADYGAWNGRPLRLPADVAQYPCAQRLEAHHSEWRRLARTGR